MTAVYLKNSESTRYLLNVLAVDDETKNILDEIIFRSKGDKDTAILPGSASQPVLKRLESSSNRRKVSVFRNMATRHRSIMLDANDAGI